MDSELSGVAVGELPGESREGNFILVVEVLPCFYKEGLFFMGGLDMCSLKKIGFFFVIKLSLFTFVW